MSTDLFPNLHQQLEQARRQLSSIQCAVQQYTKLQSGGQPRALRLTIGTATQEIRDVSSFLTALLDESSRISAELLRLEAAYNYQQHEP
jgi:hypothetical protein